MPLIRMLFYPAIKNRTHDRSYDTWWLSESDDFDLVEFTFFDVLEYFGDLLEPGSFFFHAASLGEDEDLVETDIA